MTMADQTAPTTSAKAQRNNNMVNTELKVVMRSKGA